MSRGPLAEFPPASIRMRIGFTGILALCGWMLLVAASFATARASQTGTIPSTAVAGHPTSSSSAKKSSSPSRKSMSVKTPTAHHRVHRTTRHHQHPKPEAATVAVAPPHPVPPADQQANPATVDFRQGLLSIHAQNSSLINILGQISHQTGLVVEGLSHDERMYGQYGPGNIASTLTALLDGSGYDYVIIGGEAGNSPVQLILSTSGSAGAVNASAVATTEPVSPAASEQSGPVDPTAPVQPKTPQEIFNELRRMHPQ